MIYINNYSKKYFSRLQDKSLEILLLSGAIMAPSFVFIWDVFIPGKPLHLKWASWMIALLFTLLYGLKFISKFAKRNLRILFYCQCYIASAYVVYLVYYNDFSKEYLLIFMLLVFYISLIFETIGSLLSYLLTVLVLVGMATYLERINKSIYENGAIVIFISLFIFSFIALYHLLKRIQSNRNLYEMAHYDKLTGLPNRFFLDINIEYILEAAKVRDKAVALMLIDLDKFKDINDTLGHSFGDKVLKLASLEIKQCLSKDDFLARFGSDEFVVVLENASLDHVEKTAKFIIKSFSTPIMVGEHSIDMTASIGVSFFPTDSNNFDTLIKYADLALQEVKSFGKNQYQIFNSELNEKAARRLKLENGLKRALKNSELIVYYQPQVDLQTSEIAGVEALIRWQHPEMGMIPPNEFIPLAEDSGLILPIGEWVLKTACQQVMSWQKAGLKPIHLAVNVSYHQLKHNGFYDSVQDALEESGLDPKYLELEITESVIRDAEEFKLILDKFKTLGIMLAIDDFGIGYSSLSMLQHVAINNLKIDMSFIKGVPESTKAATVVKTIIDMGKNLNCITTAEGVETQEQMLFLKESNCTVGQGYFFSRPLAPADFEKFLRDWKTSVKSGETAKVIWNLEGQM